MKGKSVNIPASVLDRLKNMARKEGFDFNVLLLRYIQERFLSRLAHSGHVNNFVLKGGYLLLAYNIHKARPTKDIDFLGVGVSANRDNIERTIAEIASMKLDDGVRFLADSVESEVIKEGADYEGIRLKLTATLGSARTIIRIDVAFGDVVTPRPLELHYPTLLDPEEVRVLAYSREAIVAEKFEAIVKLTTLNTRLKDFYDISFLAREFDFELGVLHSAMKNTFTRRQTSLGSAKELLESDFGSLPTFQSAWEAYKRRTKLTEAEEFKDLFELICSFLSPTLSAEIADETMRLKWSRSNQRWE